MESLSARTARACRGIRRGELLDAHRSILQIAREARSVKPAHIHALALQLQSSLSLLFEALKDAGFDVPPASGDELATAWSKQATVSGLVDEFEVRFHAALDAASDRSTKLPLAGRVKAYLDANFHRRITVRATAKALGCSVGSIYDVFEPTYGSTPGEYLLELCLQRARHLLTTKRSLSMEEIANRSGLGSDGTLRRNFVARYRMTPSECRTKYGTRHS